MRCDICGAECETCALKAENERLRERVRKLELDYDDVDETASCRLIEIWKRDKALDVLAFRDFDCPYPRVTDPCNYESCEECRKAYALREAERGM